MNREQVIHYIYRVIGTLEAMTMMEGRTVNEAMINVLADCVDKLEIAGAQLLAKDVNSCEGTEEAAEPEQASQ